jgi:cell division protein FtsB
MPHVVDPASRPTRPDSPPPLRRRRAPVAASPSPWRSRVLTYVLGFVTVVLVVDALVGDKGLLDTMRASRQYAELSASLARTRHDNARMRDEIRRLKEDPAAIESIAREELGLMREGEVLFVIHDDKPADHPQ